MVQNIKFKEVSNSFQDKLKEDISKIETDPKVFMKADKTTNYYKVTNLIFVNFIHPYLRS